MNSVINIVFILTVLALIITNLKTMILPNAIIFPGFIVFFLARIFLVLFDANNFRANTPQVFSSPFAATIFDSLVGAAIGLGTLWIVNQIWYQIRGFEIIGYGDMKMMGMVGVYLGIFSTIGVLFFALIIAVICVVSLETLFKGRLTALPSGFMWGIPAIFFTLISAAQVIGWFGR